MYLPPDSLLMRCFEQAAGWADALLTASSSTSKHHLQDHTRFKHTPSVT
jgi:hypothetical protein